MAEAASVVDTEQLKREIVQGTALSKVPAAELERRDAERKKRAEELKKLQDSLKA